MKKTKLALLLIAPIAIATTISIGSSYWKNAIKNDNIKANKITYTIHFETNGRGTMNDFEGLQYDTGFELPYLPSDYANFSGWGPLSGDETGTAHKGYYVLSNFGSWINDNNVLTLYAKFNIGTTSNVPTN